MDPKMKRIDYDNPPHWFHSHGGMNCGFHISNVGKLSCMLTMTFTFFLVELIVGQLTHSISMTADSFHMLSDVIALLIGLLSVVISKKKSSINTYGWVRAEILGALINAVFLISLCFSIFVEAIQRFFKKEPIEKSELLLYVGLGGLGINLIGLFIFGFGHSHELPDIECELAEQEALITGETVNAKAPQEEPLLDNPTTSHPEDATEAKKKKKSGKCGLLSGDSNMNMRAVFLHVMSDTLGSVAVIISALLNIYHEKLKISKEVIVYLDPTLSLVLVSLILSSTIPLAKESSLILLQTAPRDMRAKEVTNKLLQEVPGIVSVHDLHIWRLSAKKIIASAHIVCESSTQYMEIALGVKQFFHRLKIHSTTIQPEFKDQIGDIVDEKCRLECQKGHRHQHDVSAHQTNELTTNEQLSGPVNVEQTAASSTL